MKKEAFLVQVTFLTRVVVDTDEVGKIDKWDDLVNQVTQGIKAKISNGEVEENIETYFPDDEVLYEAEC